MGKRKLTKILCLCTAFLLGIGGVIRASFKSDRIVETKATTNDPVTYIERSWNGTSVVEEVKTCTEYTEITGKPETLSSGWYVVKRNITTYNDVRITCTGTVNLILSDNAVFRMTKGISTTGATLNIYGQENNSGLLHISNCDDSCAAIGGVKDNSGGTFNFHGGSLWAHGGFYAAAIGSGQNTTSNTIHSGAVTIYGGTVYTDTYSHGAGIGGGEKTGSGNIIIDPVKIYGGNVTAFGSWDCSGIGAGLGYTNNGELTVASGLNVLKLVYNKDPEIMTNYATTRYERMRICAPISYVSRSWDDTNKVVEESTVNCLSYTNATAFQEEYMSSDTYVVDSSFTTTHDSITIYNTCNLILFDECSWAPKKGIYVGGSGILNIYGQSNGTGTLLAGDGKQDANDAGIGGNGGLETGKVNIFGGRIKAIGGSYSAGIGGVFTGSRTYSSGDIAIYGGDVTAIGGTDNLYGRAAAGIGAGAASPGYENATPNVTIYGGNVNAIGGEYGGAGIGGGHTDGYLLSGPAGGDCGTVSILGGTVRASGGKGAKGIGAGRTGTNQGTLTVGSTLNVYGEDHKNPGVLIEEGSSGYDRSQYMVIKNKEGKLDPEHIDPSLLAGGADQTLDTIDLPDIWAWKNPTALIGDGIGAKMSYTPTNIDIYNTLEKTVDISIVEPVTYIDKEWNPTSKSVDKTIKTRTSYRVVTEDMETTWMSGWYLVNNDVTFSDRIICDGTINLILGDGCTLTTTDGISVALGDAINIYSQSDGDNQGKIVTSAEGQYIKYSPLGGPDNDNAGIINIFGGDISSTCIGSDSSYGAAAIGGGVNANSGPITIYGGKITATGGKMGAGIGGGTISSYYGPRAVGAITIYDGEVAATGGVSSSGIGAGYCSCYYYYNSQYYSASVDVEAIRIYGGNISATGGCFNDNKTYSGGAGIGCGYVGGTNENLYNTVTINEITINNATVTAQGGNFAAGIGGGGYNRGVLNIGSITFNNSNVTASGYSYSHDKGGAGIGSGYCNTNDNLGKVFIGDITINGSTVTATGDGSPGIGLANCNAESSIGNIIVNNSYIVAIGSTGYDAIGCATGSSQKGTLVLGDLMAVFGDDSENPTTEREASEYETTRWTYMTLKSLGQPVSLTLGSGISDGYVSTDYEGSILDPNGTAYLEGSVVYGFVKVIEGYIPKSNWTSIGNSVYRVSEGATVETSPINLGEFNATATTYNVTYDLGEGATHGSTHPESATFDEVFSVSAPSRPGYVFNGWTVTDGLNTSTAKWGADNTTGNDVSSSSTMCFAGSSGSVYFKNLNSSSGSVTLKANWLKSISYSYSGAYSGAYDGQEHYLIFNVTDPEVGATIKFGMTQGVYDLDECPHFTHPGEYEVYYEITADGYAPARGSIVIHIDAKTLNVTVENKDISYGDNAPTYTYTITGFVSGEDESVLGGSLVFDCAYNQGDNAGEYDINLSGFTSDDYNITYTSGTLTVKELPSSIVDAPTAKEGLVYNGDKQQLLNAGSASHGHIEYSLDGEHYSAIIPGATDAGTYTVYYKVVGDQNYSDTEPATIEVTIAKASSSVVSAPTGIDGLKYTGSAQEALNAGSAEGGTMVYSLDGVNFSTEIPTVTNVGSYTLYYKVAGDGNHNDSEVQTLVLNVSENDKTALTALISEATSYHDEILEDYKTIASTLQEAIDAANEVKNNPNMTVEQINDAITALQDALNKAKADHDAIKDAVNAIKNIGTIDNTQGCKDNIDKAREEYDALSSEQKALVDNFKTLDDSEKVYDAIETIGQIGKVGYDTEAGERIEEARKIYDSLSEDQKAMVAKTYLETLTNSEAQFASNKKTVDILFIILVCVSSLAIIGAIFFLIYLSKKKRNNDDNNGNGGNTSKKAVKAMSIGGITPLLVILDSFFLDKKYFIVYILFAIALLLWLICLIVAISKKKNKVVTKEVLSSGNDALPQVEDEEVETITDEKGNIFQIRFIKSFTAKLIQSPEETKKYYEELKNEVLSYKNTHSRVSWHYDAVNAGREYVLKFAVRGKTLCVYFPLDADNLLEKYKVEKSESKRFEDVPCMYRIKNDRRLGYAKELIAMVASNLGLEKGEEQHEVYSNLPYEPNKPLVARGLIKEQKIQVSKPVVLESKTNSDGEEVVISKDSNGNIFQIRFIKSFTAKLIQSPEETKKYYEELKNEVLSYKNTHSRVSWHHDAVNAGREYVLKFAVRGKTLCVYLPLDPEKLEEKYKVERIESKRFEDVPCMYRIKNDRRLGYAKELIAVVASNLGLEKGEEQHEVYSNLPYEPNKPLIERGLIKEHKVQINKPSEVVIDTKVDEEGDEIVTTVDNVGQQYEIRYLKSFTAKLSQTDEKIKDFYNELKNYALSFKGSSSRVSWNYDSINVGRKPALKFVMKRKNLAIYYALDTSKIGKKYKVEKVEYKKYEDVPCMYLILDERRKELAKALIDRIMRHFKCEKGEELKDEYRVPFESKEALLKKGLIREVRTRK